MAIDDDSKSHLEDVKKGKPRRFVILCKGVKIVGLQVFKKGTYDAFVKKAKADGAGKVFTGVITGKGMDLHFELNASEYSAPPGKELMLKDYLKTEADLKCNPVYDLVSDLSDVPEDDEEEGGDPKQKKPSDQPTGEKTSTETPSQSDPKGKEKEPVPLATSVVERLKVLIPEVKKAGEAKLPDAQNLKLMVSEAGVFVRKQEFEKADRLISEAESLLKKMTAKPSEPQPNPSQVKFEKLFVELDSAYQKVASKDPSNASQMRVLIGYASEQGEAGQFDKALVALGRLKPLIDAAEEELAARNKPPETESPPEDQASDEEIPDAPPPMPKSNTGEPSSPTNIDEDEEDEGPDEPLTPNELAKLQAEAEAEAKTASAALDALNAAPPIEDVLSAVEDAREVLDELEGAIGEASGESGENEAISPEELAKLQAEAEAEAQAASKALDALESAPPIEDLLSAVDDAQEALDEVEDSIDEASGDSGEDESFSPEELAKLLAEAEAEAQVASKALDALESAPPIEDLLSAVDDAQEALDEVEDSIDEASGVSGEDEAFSPQELAKLQAEAEAEAQAASKTLGALESAPPIDDVLSAAQTAQDALDEVEDAISEATGASGEDDSFSPEELAKLQAEAEAESRDSQRALDALNAAPAIDQLVDAGAAARNSARELLESIDKALA